jgi:hypothetical protein
LASTEETINNNKNNAQLRARYEVEGARIEHDKPSTSRTPCSDILFQPPKQQ